MRTLIKYLRLCRAQTAPATILLILVPFMSGNNNPLSILTLGVFSLLVHYISFGENSLHDYIGGWDKMDAGKSHHPLCTGEISVENAIRLIHWGMPLLTVVAVALTLWLSPNPTLAFVALCLWLAWGHSYNLGLNKVSILAFVPISVCFSSMGAWAWLLSHSELGPLGWLYVGYVLFTILFQISYSGFKKELLIKEKSNILNLLGAHVENGVFKPSKAIFYGWLIKCANWLIGLLILFETMTISRTVWFIFISFFVFLFLHRLTRQREYIRDRELLDMSLEEVCSIYLVIPLFIGWLESLLLMSFGLGYFLLMNRLLWHAPFPRV